MKVIVIGGKGHIGTYLCPMLIKAGYEVVCITRGSSRPYEDDPAWDAVQDLRMDRKTEPDFAQKIAEMHPDVVVDLVNYSISSTKEMVAALKGKIQQYLFCSSCWAHGRAEVLPFDPDAAAKEPLDAYGEDKYASECYLKEQYRENGFPATVIAPGQISGPGWLIISPWGNTDPRVFQKIADGEEIFLPNFGMETIHHVHGKDVAQLFFKAIVHRENALGEIFDAVSGYSVTLYGYAKHLYRFFGHEPKIGFLPWDQWCAYIDDEYEASRTYYHIARSGYFSTEKAQRLLSYQPEYTNMQTVDLAVKSYIDRGVITVK